MPKTTHERRRNDRDHHQRQEPNPVTTNLTPRAISRRLDDGWDKIEGAQARGEDAEAWEEFWISLLHEYERMHDLIYPKAE